MRLVVDPTDPRRRKGILTHTIASKQAGFEPFGNSPRASGEWHRIVLQEHRQRAAADPPQPIEHRAKH
jgi:hypothetical protein